jgi:hypothetical protein
VLWAVRCYVCMCEHGLLWWLQVQDQAWVGHVMCCTHQVLPAAFTTHASSLMDSMLLVVSKTEHLAACAPGTRGALIAR